MSKNNRPPPASLNAGSPRPVQFECMWYSNVGPSLEHFMFREGSGGSANRFNGQLLLAVDSRPVQIFYEVLADSRWHTREARIAISTSDEELAVRGDGAGNWSISGADPAMLDDVAGCIDIDLSFTPSTNLLPIRRLNLQIGKSAPVSPLWLRFPDCVLEPLRQTYTRVTADTYRYTSHTGFEGEITVDEHGVPIRYSDLWERVAHLP